MTEKELFNTICPQQDGSGIIYEKDLKKSFSVLMGKVYLWMTFALLITGVTAYGVAHSMPILSFMAEHRFMVLGLCGLELALVFIISSRIRKLSLSQATILFILYSLVNGATLSLMLFVYQEASITKAFLITAATFGTMALYGYITKKDLSSIGRLLFFALVGLIIATIVNLFLRSSGMELMISYAGVIIFIGLTAWDSQKIKKILLEEAQYGVDENSQKIALMGALQLYLDFINLFIYLLRIFGNKK